MVLNALDAPTKETWQLVRFTNLATSAVLGAFTDRDSDTDFEGQAYVSETAMEVQLPENNGLLNESPCNLVLPILPGFLTEFSSGVPHPPVYVEVVEVVRSAGFAAVALRTFNGQVASVKRNATGRKNFVSMSALPVKARLQTVTLGEPCNHQCINRFGDGRCGISLSTPPVRQSVSLVPVTGIDGTQITVATPIPTGLQDRFYQRGFISYLGTTIGIQDWRNEVNGDKQVFFLNRRPPASWLGATLTLTSGCDKTIETCRTRYNNESQFNGRGYHMPAYHPNFEDGGARQ